MYARMLMIRDACECGKWLHTHTHTYTYIHTILAHALTHTHTHAHTHRCLRWLGPQAGTGTNYEKFFLFF